MSCFCVACVRSRCGDDETSCSAWCLRGGGRHTCAWFFKVVLSVRLPSDRDSPRVSRRRSLALVLLGKVPGNVWRGNASEIKRCRGRQPSVHSWSRSVSRLDSSVHPHVHTSTHVHPHIRSHRSTSHPFIHAHFRGVHDVRMVFEDRGVTTSFPRCRSERVCVLK